MGSQYIPPPEQNVVNVGDEISINALQGIQLADPAITSTNPAATVNSVASAIAGKANLSGAAFTGRISVPPRTSASDRGFLNIGTVLDGVIAPSGANLVEGDIYFFDNDLTSGSNQIRLGYAAKNTAGVISHYAIATLSQSNQFTNTNVFQTPASTTAPTVRITQLGTGHALVVEDETANADTTPFVIGTDGRVGIHGTPAVNTNHKLAIYNGNIVFSSGYGLAFGDGTTQTTAGLTPAILFNGNPIPGSNTTISFNVFSEGFNYTSSIDPITYENFTSTIGNGTYSIGTVSQSGVFWNGTAFVPSSNSYSILPDGHLLNKGQYDEATDSSSYTQYWWAARVDNVSNGPTSYVYFETGLTSEPF